MMRSLIWRLVVMLGVIVCWSLPGESTSAGGGPENAVVVVNGKSPASREIANHYVKLRNIPLMNVIVLDDAPVEGQVDVDTFRDKILRPVLQEIVDRNLAGQIDYVLYSADFPSAIKVDRDIDALGQELTEIFTPVASINGLTFLYALTLGENAAYMQMEVNNYYQVSALQAASNPIRGEQGDDFTEAVRLYEARDFAAARSAFESFDFDHPGYAATSIWIARCSAQLEEVEPTRAALAESIRRGWIYRNDTLLDPAFEAMRDADWFQQQLADLPDFPRGSRPTMPFRSNQLWARAGLKVVDETVGRKYMLSTMLACTHSDYMSVEESIQMLERAVAADYSKPEGTFYFSRTSDVRTTTREPGFEDAITELARLGYDSEYSADALLRNRKDIIGLMLGTAKFDWAASGNAIVAGAICENLTSYGGVLHARRGDQTRLTELLRGGSAGSSGTVTEPFAIQNKFPHAYLQVHYARGASLCEAFYQSVYGPYQLLIVGDALCRPFATPPQFSIAGLDPDDIVQDEIRVTFESNDDIRRYEVFFDGRLVTVVQPGDAFAVDSNEMTDGYHELRFVAVDATMIESRQRVIVPFEVRNGDHAVQLQFDVDGPLSIDGELTGNISAPGADEVALRHDAEIVAIFRGDGASIRLPTRDLGKGPVRLQAVANFGGRTVSSAPIEVEIVD